MCAIGKTYSLPLNSGLPMSSSAMIHPIDHTSTVRSLAKFRRKTTGILTSCIICSLNVDEHAPDIRVTNKSYLYTSMISGARYHRVATYSVMIVGFSSGAELKPLLSPKSQIFSSQSALTSRLPGFRSRCTTEAEWMYFIPAFMVSRGHICLRVKTTNLEGLGIRSTGHAHL